MKLKCLTLLLALLLCLPTFLLACNREEPPAGGEESTGTPDGTGDGTGTDGGTGPNGGIADGEQVVIADPTFGIRIVYSASDDPTLVMSAQTLATLIGKKTGLAPLVEMDTLTAYDEHDSESMEILIGNTSYPESGAALESIGYGEWVATFVGNKLVINAHTISGIKSAASGFLNHLAVNVPEGQTTVSLAKDFRLVKVTDAVANEIPRVGAGELECVYDSGDLTRTIAVKKVTEADYTAYVSGLTDKGFTKYSENKIEDNLFATYTNAEGHALTAMYTAKSKTITLIMDRLDGRVLPGLEQDNVYDKTVTYDTTLTQVGLCYDLPEGVKPDDLEGGEGPDYTGGLLHIFRLEDGSFLIIDSGHGRDSNGDLIYNVLKEQAPDPDNIVIAAWILSHTHGDHVGGIVNFAPRYKDKVTVEQFIFNFPGEGSEGMTVQTQRAMDQQFPNAKQTKTHAGDVFYIRNAVVEMLYSFELIAPYDMSWYNECSLAFSVTAEGQKTMYLTDIGPLAITQLCRMYETAMDSDYVQVAHHGWNGTYQLYRLIDPAYILFNGTTGPRDKNGNDYFFKKVVTDGVTTYEKQEWITEIWRAVEGVQVFTFKEGATTNAAVYETHEDYYNAQ